MNNFLPFFNCVKRTCLKVIFRELEGVGLVVAPGIRDGRGKFSFAYAMVACRAALSWFLAFLFEAQEQGHLLAA